MPTTDTEINIFMTNMTINCHERGFRITSPNKVFVITPIDAPKSDEVMYFR